MDSHNFFSLPLFKLNVLLLKSFQSPFLISSKSCMHIYQDPIMLFPKSNADCSKVINNFSLLICILHLTVSTSIHH